LFTGLIEEIGIIRRMNASAEGVNLTIEAKKVLSGVNMGDSIAVSGPCLTVVGFDTSSFTAFAMPETLKKTTLGSMAAGERVNLERAMTLGGRLGGHLVSGHIDAVITLTARRLEGSAILLTFSCPAKLMPYIVAKGSVALDGVSLTVIDTGKDYFSVGLIPHTSGETTLGSKEVGSGVNLEVDLIGKYVENMLNRRFDSSGISGESSDTITMTLLQEKGYL